MKDMNAEELEELESMGRKVSQIPYTMAIDGTPTEVVKGWMNIHKVVWCGGGRVTYNGKSEPNDEVFSFLRRDYDNAIHLASKNTRTIRETTLENNFNIIIKQQCLERERQVFEAIQFTGDNPVAGMLLKALLNRDASSLEVAVLKHWMWQVKRKGTAKPVKNHLFISILGKQGDGKTEAIKKLVSPIMPFVWNTDVPEFTDSRSYNQHAASFVAVLDELQGGERADKQALKRIITANSVSQRKLGTNITSAREVRTSGIATSNISIKDILGDTTGMRRFFEFELNGRCDWDTINSLDYVKLWQGVDERAEEGYLTQKIIDESLRPAQNELKPKTIVEQWAEEVDWDTKDSDPYLALETVTKAINEWASVNGLFSKTTSRAVGLFFRSLGRDIVQKKIHGKNCKTVQCPREALTILSSRIEMEDHLETLDAELERKV